MASGKSGNAGKNAGSPGGGAGKGGGVTQPYNAANDVYGSGLDIYQPMPGYYNQFPAPGDNYEPPVRTFDYGQYQNAFDNPYGQNFNPFSSGYGGYGGYGTGASGMGGMFGISPYGMNPGYGMGFQPYGMGMDPNHLYNSMYGGAQYQPYSQFGYNPYNPYGQYGGQQGQQQTSPWDTLQQYIDQLIQTNQGGTTAETTAETTETANPAAATGSAQDWGSTAAAGTYTQDIWTNPAFFIVKKPDGTLVRATSEAEAQAMAGQTTATTGQTADTGAGQTAGTTGQTTSTTSTAATGGATTYAERIAELEGRGMSRSQAEDHQRNRMAADYDGSGFVTDEEYTQWLNTGMRR